MTSKKKAAKKETRAIREKGIPEYKIKLVSEIAHKIKEHRTVLIASTKGLPSSQFHEIKKNLRGKADVKVAKKSIVLRAIKSVEKGALQNLKDYVGANVALFFSQLDPFELSGLLADNQSATKAKAGDIAPEDIRVEPGPTDLIPGPAISELSGVGLKVAVESGKLAIKQPATIVKQGETIKENVASVMGKLGIAPMKVGFEPIAAFDAKEDKVYSGIRIDKKGTLDNLRESIAKALGFAVNVKYIVKETLSFFLAKAQTEEGTLQALVNKIQANDTTTKEDN
jgi:large subunit ribosomal protein L10